MNERETPPPNEDAELRAILALIKYLEPLGHGARVRVVKWAEQRFVSEPLPDFKPDAISGFIRGLGEAAETIDGMNGVDLIQAALEVARIRNSLADNEGTCVIHVKPDVYQMLTEPATP